EPAVEAQAGTAADAPAKSGLFARKATASASGAGGTPSSEGGPAAESESSQSQPTKEEIHAQLAGFAADSESPLTEEDLKKLVADPDFEQKLAEAEKELEAQLAALLDDGANA
ncbi:MAG TPA: hypothetical protein VFH70_09050, partial [Acidimicrobiales bacterium]|nr:hypothetical protein [Acidimicrobiales bacterium]